MSSRVPDAAATARAAAVRVSAPASSANLGPGFDALGLALDLRNDAHVRAVLPGTGRTRVVVEGEGEGELALDDESPTEANLLVRALRAALASGGASQADVRVSQKNRIPLRRGLGSSAAAAVMGSLAGLEIAATFAARRDGPFPEEVVAAALPFEGHPDNLAAATVGGLTVSWLGGRTARYLRLDAPRGLAAVLCIPEVEVATARARAILPDSVPFADAAATAGRTALLVAALVEGKVDLLREAMEDRLHQPHRIGLLPPMGAAVDAALGAGARGACLSGSGSTVLALCPEADQELQQSVGAAMVRAFFEGGIASQVRVCRPSPSGALVIREVFGGRHG